MHKITTAYFVGHRQHFHCSQFELTWDCPLSPLTIQLSTQVPLIFCSTLSANLPYFQVMTWRTGWGWGQMHKNIGIIEQMPPPHFQRSLQWRSGVFSNAWISNAGDETITPRQSVGKTGPAIYMYTHGVHMHSQLQQKSLWRWIMIVGVSTSWIVRSSWQKYLV